MRNLYRIYVRKPKGKSPLGRPWHRWKNNVKVNLRDIGYKGLDWIHMAENRKQW
jgi:hypothetical protein